MYIKYCLFISITFPIFINFCLHPTWNWTQRKENITSFWVRVPPHITTFFAKHSFRFSSFCPSHLKTMNSRKVRPLKNHICIIEIWSFDLFQNIINYYEKCPPWYNMNARASLWTFSSYSPLWNNVKKGRNSVRCFILFYRGVDFIEHCRIIKTKLNWFAFFSPFICRFYSYKMSVSKWIRIILVHSTYMLFVPLVFVFA